MKTKWILSVLFVYVIGTNLGFANSSNDEKEGKSAMTVSISGKLKLCSLDDKGYAFVDVKGGNPPYTITSNNNLHGQILENLNPGTYTVNIEDKDGLKLQERFIVQPPIPMILEMKEITHANQIKNGSAKINLKGVYGNSLKIEWSNGLRNVLEADDLKPGIYSIKVYDGGGCDSTIHFEIKDLVSHPEFSFSASTIKDGKENFNSIQDKKKKDDNGISKQYSKEELRKIAEEIMATMDNK